MILSRYSQFGGDNPETASLGHLLAYRGVVAAHDGKPLSEAMLLGIAGGIGGGYWLLEFGKQANVFIGTRHLWQNPKQYLETACKHLGIRPVFKETSGVKAAAKNLAGALEDGQPAILWVDLAHMPYSSLPKSMSGMAYHYVVVYGTDEKKGVAYVSDRASSGLTVPLSALAAARARISSSKNRLMTIEKPPKKIDIKKAIVQGIRACCADLNNPKTTNFGLPSFAKWADMVNNHKDKKGWPQVFAEGNEHFYAALRWSYSCIETYQTPGAAFRGMYADFLDQAAEIIELPALKPIAAQYRQLASLWRSCAHEFLPDSSKPLKTLRDLIEKRTRIFKAEGDAGVPQVANIVAEMEALEGSFRADPPLTSGDRLDLFAKAQQQLRAIHALEVEACTALQSAIA